MKPFLDDALSAVMRNTQAGARKLLLSVLLGLAGVLIGAAGIGFLTAWAYVTLSMAVDPRSALLLVGLGLTLLAGCLLGMVRFLLKPAQTVPPESPRAASGGNTNSGASLVAFTAAFVLGRYLNGRKRD